MIPIQTPFHPLESQKSKVRWEINAIQFTVKKWVNKTVDEGFKLNNWKIGETGKCVGNGSEWGEWDEWE